jgi:hypothetical protein
MCRCWWAWQEAQLEHPRIIPDEARAPMKDGWLQQHYRRTKMPGDHHNQNRDTAGRIAQIAGTFRHTFQSRPYPGTDLEDCSITRQVPGFPHA